MGVIPSFRRRLIHGDKFFLNFRPRGVDKMIEFVHVLLNAIGLFERLHG